MTTTVAGLDLSLRSAGIVGVSDDQPGHEGVAWPWHRRCCGRDGNGDETYRQRSRRVREQTRTIIRHLEPLGKIDLVVVEGPIYGGTIMPSYFDRAGLFHGVYGWLDAKNIPVAVIPPTSGHMWLTGVGSLPKDPGRLKKLILASARALVPEVHIANDDIADALGYALMGGMHLGMTMPFRPKYRHHNGVAAATWPEGAA